MIIVSQDKTRIINFDRVEILGINIDDNTEISCCFDDVTILLGKYQAEERAKEVLQEIADLYKQSNYICKIANIEYQETNRIFEMPED